MARPLHFQNDHFTLISFVRRASIMLLGLSRDAAKMTGLETPLIQYIWFNICSILAPQKKNPNQWKKALNSFFSNGCVCALVGGWEERPVRSDKALGMSQTAWLSNQQSDSDLGESLEWRRCSKNNSSLFRFAFCSLSGCLSEWGCHKLKWKSNQRRWKSMSVLTSPSVLLF